MIVGKWPYLLGVFFILALPSPAESREFERALPGRTFAFPEDHYAHPKFQTEWWYYTGHIRSSGGRSFGYQLTFFRSALRWEKLGQSRWSIRDLYFAHFAITDEDGEIFMFQDKISRGALGLAGAAVDRLHIWIEDWSLMGDGSDHLLEAHHPSMAIRFRLTPLKPPVINGINGVSQKAEGQGYASYYYSMTRMMTEGQLTLDGESMTVEGLSWMDHEFGSNQLRDYQQGWDWFSLQLEEEVELMIYVIRHQDGQPDPYSSGTFIYPNGTSRHLRLNEFEIEVLATWRSRTTGATYPSKWRIRIPAVDMDLTVTPTVSDQELITEQSTRVIYWEGSVQATGTYEEKPILGVGYVELTGYATSFSPGI